MARLAFLEKSSYFNRKSRLFRLFQSYYYSKVRASGPHEVHPPPCPVETPVSRFPPPPLGFCAPHVGDVVGVRSIFWVLSDQTKVRSKRPLIRKKCARNVLWSDKSAVETSLIRQKCARNVLWSDKSALETSSDQTKVRSKRLSDQTKVRPKRLWSDKSALETSSDQTKVRSKTSPDQTSVRSKLSLIRLVCARNCLWSDRPRPKWPLIRQVPDHCPDESALEAFSRPCNSSAPGTCVRSKLVWSGVTSVWPPRPGLKKDSVRTRERLS